MTSHFRATGPAGTTLYIDCTRTRLYVV